jgi:signal transduction histidine kinase
LGTTQNLKNRIVTALKSENSTCHKMPKTKPITQFSERIIELAQRGLVLEAANHDYHAMMGKAREALSNLEKHNKSQDVEILKNTLLHLDAILQNWDPIINRTQGNITQISGAEIWNFVLNAFPKKEREPVRFERTDAFQNSLFTNVNRPVLLGAVHNLIRNGIYWAEKTESPAKVKLSNGYGGFIISDSGPGIPIGDREKLFQPGFSTRNSKGLGLFIAKSALNSFGYTLEILETPTAGALEGANFLFKKTE